MQTNIDSGIRIDDDGGINIEKDSIGQRQCD